jgi:hypothetical protein
LLWYTACESSQRPTAGQTDTWGIPCRGYRAKPHRRQVVWEITCVNYQNYRIYVCGEAHRGELTHKSWKVIQWVDTSFSALLRSAHSGMRDPMR